MNLKKFINMYPVILTECSIIERLKREFDCVLNADLLNTSMLYNHREKQILKDIYSQYIQIARNADLPILLLTPTWRANKEKIEKYGKRFLDSNKLAFNLLDKIRIEQEDFSSKILIGGLLGCKGDAYNPSEALNTEEAFKFHLFQAEQLKSAGVDFLIASTLPALSEAKGIAKAFVSQNISYILSFIIRSDGKLLDGTYLSDAIQKIDNDIITPPDFYMINCVHPKNLMTALNNKLNNPDVIKNRVIGLQANSSMLNPEELDNKEVLDADNEKKWAKNMFYLYQKKGLKILGGCCGTNHLYLQSIISNLKEPLL